MKHYMMARFAAGELPLWTPYVSGGMPFLSDPSNQLLYPPNVIYFLFSPVERAISLSVALHSLLGMCAFAGLCRVLGISRWIAAWSGITYGLTGYFLSIGDNVNFLPAVVWVPSAIAVYQLGLNRHRYRYSALTALCLSLVVLAGDPLNAVLLVAVLALMSIMTIRFGSPAHEWRNGAVFFPGAHLLLTLALAILMTAAQVLPTLELIPASVRHSGLEHEQIGLWSFPLARLLEFFQPYLFGSHFPVYDFLVPDLYPSKSGPWASSVYLGTIPVVLALVGAIVPDKRRLVWLIVLVTALLLSFGANAPFNELIVEHIPFIGTQRYPEKYIFWVTVSACVLASLGAQTLLDNRRLDVISVRLATPITKLAVGVAVIGAVAWSSVYLPAKAWFWEFAFLNLSLWQMRIPFSINHFNVLLIHTLLMFSILLVWLLVKSPNRAPYLALMLVVAALDLFWVHYRSVPLMPAGILDLAEEPFALRTMAPLTAGHPYRVYYDTESPGGRITFRPTGPFNARLAAAVPNREKLIAQGYPHLYGFLYRRDRLHPNGGILHGVNYLNGPLSPLQLATNVLFENHMLRQDSHKFTAMANVRYVVTGIEPMNPIWNDARFVTIESDPVRNLRVLENNEWLSRVLLVPNAIGTNAEIENIYTALDGIGNPRSHVTVVSDVSPHAEQPLVEVSLNIERPSPGRFQVSGSSPYQRAYLLLNESYVDGWRATVNGQSAKVLRANLRFMTIPVEAGPFEVTFEYRPKWFLTGIALSGAGLLLCAGFVVYPLFKRT